jgi:hypothetical protein
VIVREIIVLPGNEKLIAEAVLIDSSKLYIRERYRKGKLIKYSYHLIKSGRVIRWDNVPHHKNVKTYPFHKHVDDKIYESEKMDIGKLLSELNSIVKGE